MVFTFVDEPVDLHEGMVVANRRSVNRLKDAMTTMNYEEALRLVVHNMYYSHGCFVERSMINGEAALIEVYGIDEMKAQTDMDCAYLIYRREKWGFIERGEPWDGKTWPTL